MSIAEQIQYNLRCGLPVSPHDHVV
uniref:Uncharacterized protein n=1 Tax=Anguilla anguilla TaxID=7936 RepID=A0A0E9RPH9_ANGAN